MRVPVHRHGHRTIRIEGQQAVEGLLPAVAAADDFGAAAAARDLVTGFTDGQVADVQFRHTVQGRIHPAQIARQIAFEFVCSVDDISRFLRTQAGEYQFADGDVAARPMRAAECTIAGNIDRRALWHTEIGTGHQPVHIKGVVVGSAGNSFAFLQGGVARYITTIEVIFQDLSHVDCRHGKSGHFSGNGGFQDFRCFCFTEQGDDLFSGFAAGGENEKNGKEKGRADFLIECHKLIVEKLKG